MKNPLPRLLSFKILGVATGLALALPAAAESTAADVVGRWQWKPTSGSCTEIHEYFADGRLITHSGDEILESRYVIAQAPQGPGLFRVVSTTTGSNGKPDCLGKLTPIGNTATVYLRFNNAGWFYTCAGANSMSCYGSAAPAPK